jgi:3-mercaptopyruvate sulfurtransferase SseA
MRMISKTAGGALLLAMAGLAVACGAKAEPPRVISTEPVAQAAPSPRPAEDAHSHEQHAEENQMPRIEAEEAKKLVKEGKAVIIDVRGTDAYKISHIKGALDIPLTRLEAGDFKGIPKDKRIIAYCA